MENIFNFVTKFLEKDKNKDIMFLIFLFLSLYFGVCLMKHSYGQFFIDLGREAYLPELILKGKVLYKDIFGMYNPFSYQINAVLYKLFGVNIATLYWASFINAYLILVGNYLICRRFINSFFSFSIMFFICVWFVVTNLSVISYIQPYSFAFPYALMFFTFAVYYFLLFMDNEKDKYIWLSSLFIGLSLANRFEYAIAFLPMLIVLILRKIRWQKILTALGLFLLPSVLSYGVLFLQGFNFSDLMSYINLYIDFFKTPEQIYYTSRYAKVNWNFNTLLVLLTYFTIFLTLFLISNLYFSLFNKGKIGKILGCALSVIYINLITIILLNYVNSNNLFSWTTIALVIIILCSIIKYRKITNQKLFFVVVVGLLSMARINFLSISYNNYGIYFFLTIIAFWIYFINSDVRFRGKTVDYKTYTSFMLIIVGILYAILVAKVETIRKLPIVGEKGVVNEWKMRAPIVNNVIEWINTNTKEGDTVLVLPEGVMFNFITGRPTDNMYYHLIPNHISTLGEDKIVKDLGNNPPKVIITQNTEYETYNKKSICEDFGLKICKFIYNNYKLKQTYSTNLSKEKSFEAKIFTLKKYNK